MKIYCGTDIIEVSRVKDAIDNLGNQFIDRIYTIYEKEYCNSKGNMKYQHFAARFAVKEAIFKAISPILDDKFDITWTDVEIRNDKLGRPYAVFLNKKLNGIEQLDISISHLKEYAISNCIAIIK